MADEPVRKRNPGHPTLEAMDGQWAKIVALLMYRDGVRYTVIPTAVLDAAERDPHGLNVAIRLDDPQGIALHLVGDAEARVLAKQEGA